MKKIILLLFIGFFSKSYSQTDYTFVYNNDSIIKAGISLYDKGKYVEAIKEYEKINKTDPKFLDAQYEKAMALSGLEKKDELKAFFEDLYQKNRMPEFPQLYILYGSFLSDQKEYEQSEKIFIEGTKYTPNSSNLLYNFAILYVRKGESQKSVDLLERIITNNPNHSSSHYLLGAIALDNGKITEATLAFLSYLIIAPQGRYAEKAILNLNAKFGQNYLGNNKMVFSKTGDNFEDIEVILRNQLPLNPAYKVKSVIDDVIIRQIQAVAEYTQEHKMGEGFFETTYIPWIKDMMDKQRFEAFSYYILQSMEAKIGKKLTSQKKKITDFYENYLLKDFWSIYAKRKIDLFGNQQEVVVTLKNRNPYLIGLLIDGKKEGKYKYLNEDGNLSGELNFKNDQLNGLQKYYNEKGNLDEEKSFLNGKINGTRTAYYSNGLVSVIENYKEDKLEGIGTSYYVNGGKQCEINFTNGERDGKLSCLYPNGSIKSESHYVKGKLNGLYSTYNEVGDLTLSYNCVNDSINGDYHNYYNGKLIKSEAVYAHGKIQGSFKNYFSNGALEKEDRYVGGKIKNVTEYSSDEKKATESIYNDKEELENFSYFDTNKNKYFEEKYKSGELKSGIQYAENNPNPVEINASKKPFVINDFYGNKLATGNFEKGKKDGEWNHTFPSGIQRLKENYSHGKQNGLSQDYEHNGFLSGIKNYTNDSINGLYEIYENGKLNRSYSYEKGKQNGPYKKYNPDGSISSECYLINGSIHFKKLDYWQNGTISTKDTYIEGIITSSETYNNKGEKENNIDYSNKTGKFTTSFNNGTTIEVCELVHGELNGKYLKKDKFNTPILEMELTNGVKNNLYKGYSPYGTINREINYYCGKKNGVDKSYDLVGNLKFSDETTFSIANGKHIRYYHNQSKMFEYNQKNDVIDGEFTYYNQKNEPLLIIGYANNHVQYYIKRSKSGELNEKIQIKDETAEISSSYPNGKIAITLSLVKGNFEGKHIVNNELGKLEFESNYSKNQLNGERLEYYANGNLYKRERFKDNAYDGIQEYFKEDAKPWLTSTYKNDELHGNTLIYNEGKLVLTKKYDSDELVEIIK